MIDLKTAYQIVKKLPDRNFLIEVTDFGKFYGFVFAEKKPSNDEPFGGAYDCVDKETGEQFTFNPCDDFGLFDKGVTVPIEELVNLD